MRSIAFLLYCRGVVVNTSTALYFNTNVAFDERTSFLSVQRAGKCSDYLCRGCLALSVYFQKNGWFSLPFVVH